MNNYRIMLFLTVLLFVESSLSTHKIIYLISPPRSLSVAFLRMMETRGDFAILHEPSQLAWNLLHSPELVQNWYLPNAPRSFIEVKNIILQTAEHHNVFVKEMSFAVRDFLLNDFDLMKNPQVYFVFLVRNPHHTTISMYKKIISVFDAVAYELSEAMGYQALYETFKTVKQHAAQEPYIMLTEDLYNNPEETIQKFCNHVGIDFKPESLHWSDLGEHFTGDQAWHEIKYKEITHHWHGDAIRSTGFSKPNSYEVDEYGNPTFAEITNPEHRDTCKKIYLEQLFYYNLLLK